MNQQVLCDEKGLNKSLYISWFKEQFDPTFLANIVKPKQVKNRKQTDCFLSLASFSGKALLVLEFLVPVLNHLKERSLKKMLQLSFKQSR